VIDPRQGFSDAAEPIVDEILSQWSPPLKEQHYEQLQREINDELFGRGMRTVLVDGRMLLDEAGQPVRCASIDQGGGGPYQVFIKFTIVEMEQLTP
jgi:hypothetical protein